MINRIKHFLQYDIRHGVTRVVAAWERARRGWSRWDINGPGLDRSVFPALGEQLLYYASVNQSWSDQDYPEFEDYQAAVRKAGRALVAMKSDIPVPPAYEEYLFGINFKDGKSMTFDKPETPQVKSEREWVQAEEDRIVREAQEALHWVADNAYGFWT